MDFNIEIQGDLTPMAPQSYADVLSGGATIPMRVCPLCRVVLGASEHACPRDGQAPIEVEGDAVPPELGERFSVMDAMAKGDTGTLWLADDRQTGRRGSLKVVRFKPGTNVAEKQRLKRELAKQATLTNPHLTLPIATGESSGVLWLFREGIDGISLRVRLGSGPLPVNEAL